MLLLSKQLLIPGNALIDWTFHRLILSFCLFYRAQTPLNWIELFITDKVRCECSDFVGCWNELVLNQLDLLVNNSAGCLDYFVCLVHLVHF